VSFLSQLNPITLLGIFTKVTFEARTLFSLDRLSSAFVNSPHETAAQYVSPVHPVHTPSSSTRRYIHIYMIPSNVRSR